MQPQPRRGNKWRRFTRKYGVLIFVAFCTVAALAVVGVLMYVLTSMNWRARY